MSCSLRGRYAAALHLDLYSKAETGTPVDPICSRSSNISTLKERYFYCANLVCLEKDSCLQNTLVIDARDAELQYLTTEPTKLGPEAAVGLTD